MGLMSMEQSPAVYRADFVLYVVLAAGLLGSSLWHGTPHRAVWVGAVLGGFGLWSLIEYLVHRFVLHRIQPFKRLHAVHHARPRARYGLPTLFSLPLFAGLVFVPLLGLLGLWSTLPLMAGVLVGYLFYGLAHHLAHHGPSPLWPRAGVATAAATLACLSPWGPRGLLWREHTAVGPPVRHRPARRRSLAHRPAAVIASITATRCVRSCAHTAMLTTDPKD